MRAFNKLFPASVLASALFLSACGQTATEPDLVPRNLTDASVVAEYCGEKARKVSNLIVGAAESPVNSVKRKQLEAWGLDPKNDEQIRQARSAIHNRTQVQCGADGKPLGLSADQLFAADVCLPENERKALKPEGAKTTDHLKAKCREVGQATFDSLSTTHKQRPTTQSYQKDLANDDLRKVAFAAAYMKTTKQSQDNNVPPSDTEDQANAIRAMFPGVTAADLGIGSDAIDHGKHTIEKGGGVFLDAADRYLKTKEEIAAFLGESNNPKAVVARDHILKAAIAAGGEDERVRVMTGEGFIPIQLKGASQILGTSYFQDGQVKIVDQWRQSLPGDIYWLYFTYDEVDGKVVRKLVPEATLRADCANVNGTQIRIVRPDTPPAPSVTQPPGEEKCPPGTVMQPNGECHIAPPPVCVNCGQPVCTENCVPLQPKDYTQGSGYQGNAPTGSGLNADPGPGEYKAPSQMEQPPSTPYVAPAAPAPQPAPVQQPGGTVIPAPNPNPTPFTPAPEEPGVNPAPVPGSTEPPRNEGEIDNPWG